MEGDRNTKYFHVVANQGRRKTTIHSVEGPDGMTNNTFDILKVASEYYKNLFRYEPRPNVNIDAEFFSREEKLGAHDREMLENGFSEEEIRRAVFESYSDGAPEPDGLSFIFYQKFWSVIKQDFIDMFEDFHKGELDLYILNFVLLTVIPKVKDARTMSKFRPISLLNCSYKIFTKVLTNRVGKVVDKLIASNQSTFIKGRYILKSVIAAHEVVYSVYQGKQQGFVLKLDYKKAYDKVNWDFLLDVLEKRGFGGRWI
jgi:hypothetical protein